MEIREWLGKELSARGFDAEALDAPLPFELPAHAIAEGAKYDMAPPQEDALAQLAAWFTDAELLLSELQRRMCERGLAASPVRCWPHHFDIAALTMLPARDTDVISYIGLGLSPGDVYYEGPYFYVSVSPDPNPVLLPKFTGVGHWHLYEFTAAVLTWDNVLSSKEQKAVARDFLHGAVAAALKILADSRSLDIGLN